MRAIILLYGVVLLAMVSDANAVVLCAKARGDGTFSTTVKIREACAARETVLDAATLGLQGPPGPAGPAGSGALSVVDGAGTRVGPAIDGGHVLVDLPSGPSVLAVTPAGFPDVGVLVYETADCSGQAYEFPGDAPGLAPSVLVRGGVALLPSGVPPTPIVAQSYSLGSGCTTITLDGLVTSPLIAFDLSTLGFVPPFRLVQ